MNAGRIASRIVAALSISGLIGAGHAAPTEAQCRDMVNMTLEQMRSAPLERERDRQQARVAIDKAESIVRDNRQRGISECETWSAIGRLVVHQ